MICPQCQRDVVSFLFQSGICLDCWTRSNYVEPVYPSSYPAFGNAIHRDGRHRDGRTKCIGCGTPFDGEVPEGYKCFDCLKFEQERTEKYRKPLEANELLALGIDDKEWWEKNRKRLDPE